ncbi:hypothetical protein INT47_000050, partial [Mucor saturninus]
MMTYQIDTNSRWHHCNTEPNCNTEKSFIKPSSSISNLSRLFIATASYYNLTKQQALDAIGYLLYEYDDTIHVQLLDCFIQHKFLKRDTTSFTIHDHEKITGIFTPLTKCYSPSCQINQTCYSPLCPNKRISGLLHLTNAHEQDTTKDWIESIPHHIRLCTDRKELKRQAGIAELLMTESHYRQDLQLLHSIYAVPLLESDTIPISKRQRFYNNVFGNYLDILHLHNSFSHQFRHSGYFIVGRVGTIILQHVTVLIEPYILYASNHIKAIYCMSLEQKYNPLFAKFVVTQNALKSTRRLGLRHYLSSPTLWMGKFKLMIQAILKNTVDDADQLSLKASLAILHDTLCRMNTCANLSPEEFRFEELSTSIYCTTLGQHESSLYEIPDGSSLIREEALWLARSSHPLLPSLCHVFLFSHALVLTHPRVISGRTEYHVVTSIPLQLLSLDHQTLNASMIRRLSFASTSMVSTPLHLFQSLRRQKSTVSEPEDKSRSRIKRMMKSVSLTRRDSAPAAFMYNHRATTQRTVRISHMAFPENVYKLEFLSRSDRLIWKNVIGQVICDSTSSRVFDIQRCPTLAQMGKIKCAHTFGKSMVVFGTQSGVWMGQEEGPFDLVLPNVDVYQLCTLRNKLLVLNRQKRNLIAYRLNAWQDWCVVKRTSVTCFTVGRIRNQDVIVYLTKRLHTTWLVIIVPSSRLGKHWFKKYITEHKVSIKDPTTLQVTGDSVFVRSHRFGIERIEIDIPETQIVFRGVNVGMVALLKTGIVCDSQYAYAVSLWEKCEVDRLVRIKFESPIHHVAVMYPYLIAFSSSVIEVRHMET